MSEPSGISLRYRQLTLNERNLQYERRLSNEVEDYFSKWMLGRSRPTACVALPDLLWFQNRLKDLHRPKTMEAP